MSTSYIEQSQNKIRKSPNPSHTGTTPLSLPGADFTSDPHRFCVKLLGNKANPKPLILRFCIRIRYVALPISFIQRQGRKTTITATRSMAIKYRGFLFCLTIHDTQKRSGSGIIHDAIYRLGDRICNLTESTLIRFEFLDK
ncbi:hypothetical protein LXL04_026694 [Taraxacum kok-saghyz]